jgi:hypothetical protein
LRLDPFGQRAFGLIEPLGNLLTRKIEVGVILEITVTWLNPLREIERELSSPGIPAIAVSTGKVTSRSMSSGPRLGSTVLICTCLLVMSGTASIGSFKSSDRAKGGNDQREDDHAPAEADRAI